MLTNDILNHTQEFNSENKSKPLPSEIETFWGIQLSRVEVLGSGQLLCDHQKPKVFECPENRRFSMWLRNSKENTEGFLSKKIKN